MRNKWGRLELILRELIGGPYTFNSQTLWGQILDRLFVNLCRSVRTD